MAPAGGISVYLSTSLRRYCGERADIRVAASSVRSLLVELERAYPALHRSVCDETGAVRRHVNIFVNSDHVRDRDGLDTPLAAGDEVTLMPAVSGGS